MVFKRINKDTVRCILTEQDMIDNGLQIEDFFKNKGKVQSFLENLVEQAKEQIGYEAKGGILAMQVMPLPNNCLAVTFSDEPSGDIDDMMDQIREVAEDILPGLLADGDDNAEKNKPDKVSRKYDGRLYEFDNLESVERLCASIELEKVNKSILYKEYDKYYMILRKGKLSKKVYESLCFSFLEYGRLVSDNPAVLVNWQEHKQPMIKKNAIGILKNI